MNETAATFNKRVARGMRGACEGEKSGALICQTRDAKRLVFFERGYLVGAKSESVSERLGEVMVAEGRVRRAELQKAMRFIRSGRKLGRILVELGYLKSGEIETFVRRQIILIASAMLISKPERLLFSTALPVEAVTLSPVSVGDVFLAALSHLTRVELDRQKVLIVDYVLAQTPDALAIAGQMKLSSDEARVLEIVDGSNTVGDVLSASVLSEDRTLRLLLALHQAGIVSLKEKRPSEAAGPGPIAAAPSAVDPFENELTSVFKEMQCKDHWQVLGLTRDAAYPDIDRAYRELAERFGPEKYRHISDTGFQEKISSIRARLKEAFSTLSSGTSTNVYGRLVEQEGRYAEKKESWEAIPSPPEAPAVRAPAAEPDRWERPKNLEVSTDLFQQAKRAYCEQDFWRAIELCRASIELGADNDPERFHLLGKALSENPRWRQDAEQNFKIAHNLKPWEPRYLVSMGKLYEKVGLHQRAQRLYDQVRAMDPSFPIDEEADIKKAKARVSQQDDLEGEEAV